MRKMHFDEIFRSREFSDNRRDFAADADRNFDLSAKASFHQIHLSPSSSHAGSSNVDIGRRLHNADDISRHCITDGIFSIFIAAARASGRWWWQMSDDGAAPATGALTWYVANTGAEVCRHWHAMPAQYFGHARRFSAHDCAAVWRQACRIALAEE